MRQGLQVTPQSTTLFDRAGELTASLEVLRQQIHGPSPVQAIKRLVVEWAHVAALGKTRSVEQYPRPLGLSASVHEAPEICQIDKLARYLFLCKDLLRITRKEEDADLFRDFDVIHLEAFPGISRPVIKEDCHVHAEIQQSPSLRESAC